LSTGDVGNRYIQRLARILADSEVARVADPATIGDFCLKARPAGFHAVENLETGQQEAVDAVRHVVSGQRRRPVLLTADRGRGKSAALGYAAAGLLQDGAHRILVTAIRRAAVDVVFRHAAELLQGAAGFESRPSSIKAVDGTIEFIEPQRLLESKHEADLVVVDEAAALPLHWLGRLLKEYPRLAFATTLHGYEGSGRGFANRFMTLLDRETRGWRRIRLTEPIRWASGDPVEALVFDALLMNAEPATGSIGGRITPDGCVVELLDRDHLCRNETLLRDYFGLLVQSHYRTRPNDLRYLLDGPNIELWALRHEEVLLGAAVVSREGGFDADTARRVWTGKSRPRGHMIAETVCYQLGVRQWPRLRGARIVRIAVHAGVRRRGLGAAMTREIFQSARKRGFDYVGCSFGSGREAAGFWSSCGFVPLWLSARRNVSSGARSILMVKPASNAAVELSRQARARFLEGFRFRLAGLYGDENPGHIALMFAGAGCAESPSTEDLEDLHRFCAGEATFEACFTGIWNVATAILSRTDLAAASDERGRRLIVSAVLQQRRLADCAAQAGLNGRKQVLDELRLVFGRLLRTILANSD
jgi:tRNA(Met) cytidine acetyltransferase